MITERVILYSTKPLNGKYRYRDVFQILPSRRKPLQDGRFYFPLVLEFAFESKLTPYFRFGYPYGSDELTKRIIEFQHLLSVSTQFFFFGHIKSKSHKNKLTNSKSKSVNEGTIEWYQDKVLDDRNVREIVIPPFIDLFLDAYFSLDAETYSSIRKAMYLFYAGVEMRGQYPSLSFAALVSSIETLINIEKIEEEYCQKCGQRIYRVRQRYLDFLKVYVFGGKMTSKNKKFADEIYQLRSRLLHAGQLLLADVVWNDNGNDEIGTEKWWAESLFHKDLISLARVSLVNWCITTDRIRN